MSFPCCSWDQNKDSLFRNAFYQSSFESTLKVSHDWLSPGTTSTPNTVVDAIQYCRNLSTLFPLGTKKRHFHSPKCYWELNTQYQETVMIFFYNKIKMLKRIKVPLYFSAHSFTYIVRGKRTLKGKHPANRQPHVTVLVLNDVTLHWSLFQMVLSLYCVNLLLQKPTAQTLELID